MISNTVGEPFSSAISLFLVVFSLKLKFYRSKSSSGTPPNVWKQNNRYKNETTYKGRKQSVSGIIFIIIGLTLSICIAVLMQMRLYAASKIPQPSSIEGMRTAVQAERDVSPPKD